MKRFLPVLLAGAALLAGRAQATSVATIEDFSRCPTGQTWSGAGLTPAGSAHLANWQVGGAVFTFQDVGTDRVMYPSSSYSGLDIGIKLTVSNSEYVPTWDSTLSANAISLANASDLQFTFVNTRASASVLTSGLTVTMYYYDTSAGATASVNIKVIPNNTTVGVNEYKQYTVLLSTLTGFDKTVDLVYGFHIPETTWAQQVGWSFVGCTITSDGLPAPDAVTNLSTSSPDLKKMTVNWSAPADQSGWWDSVASYDIRYSTSPIDDTNWDAASLATGEPTPGLPGTAQSCVVTGLAPGTTYYFAMKSSDTFGHISALSNVCTNTTTNDLIPPAAVTNLAVSVYHISSAKLTWTASGDDGNVGTASSYDLRYATFPIDDTNWSTATAVTLPVPQPAGTPETFTMTTLQPDTTYYFALKVADDLPNLSPISNLVSVHMPPLPTAGPNMVSDLTPTGMASRSITLGWTAPADQAGGSAASYDIRYSTSPIDQSNWGAAVQVSTEPTPLSPGSAQTFTVGGLNPTTTYYFAIKSTDWANNVSDISNIASAMTRPVMLPVTVHNPWLVNDRVANTHDINTMAATYSNAYTPDGVIAPTTEEDKAINIYNNQKRRLYHWADEPPAYMGTNRDPTYNQNVFGWGLCGSHAMQGLTIAKYAGFQHTRFRTINSGKADAHNIFESQYADGTWHLLDDMTTMYVYTRTTPRHIASLAEIAAAGNLIQTAVAEGRACPGLLLCGDSPSWYDTSAATAAGSDETLAPLNWSPNMDLRVGQTFKRTWESWASQYPTPKTDGNGDGVKDPPYHHEANKDYKDTVNIAYWEPYALTSSQSTAIGIPMVPTYRRWANGTDTLAPDFRGPAYQSMLYSTSHDIATYNDDAVSPDLHGATIGTQGEAVFKINFPYYITDANFSGDFVRTNSGDVCNVQISTDGSAWSNVTGFTVPIGTTHVSNQSIRTQVGNRMNSYYIKIQVKATSAKSNAGVSNFVVVTTFEHNKGAMAYLDKGVNHITLTFDNPSELVASSNVLHVTYKWKEYDGTNWTIDRQVDRYVNSSPYNFTITTGGAKVPRTEYILMEIVQPPSPDLIAPAAVTDLTAPTDGIKPKAIDLTWTAPANDGNNAASGRADSYDLRYSTSSITADNFYAATQVSPAPIPGTPGTIEHFTVGHLNPQTTYYFAIKTSDAAPNTSLISNIASATTLTFVPDLNPPEAVTDLAAAATTTLGQYTLTWTAPIDHEDGYVTAYDLRWSTSPITAANFASATIIPTVTPNSPGIPESITATNLPTGVLVYFAVKSVDASGNWSPIQTNTATTIETFGSKTLQNGLSGYVGCQDTYMSAAAVTTKYEGSTELQVAGMGGGTNRRRAIVKFDLSSLPTRAVITSAKLYMYVSSNDQTGTPSGSYSAYHVYTSWSASAVSWNMPWTVSGGADIDAEDARTPKQAGVGVWYAFDVTSRVQNYIANPGNNNGWVIKPYNDGDMNQDYFYASEYTGDITLRPKLVISDMSDPIPPAPIQNLASSSVTTTTVNLTWTATGDDGNTGTATRYDLRYSTTPITDMTTFNAATQVTGLTTPKPAGQTEAFTITGLTASTTYYFAVVAYDDANNSSGLSNVITVSTPAPRKIGDINNDGYVNVGDLQLLVAAWGSDGSGSWGNWNPDADLNTDGFINVADLQILVAHWGQ